MRSVQVRVVREIRMLRAMWRALKRNHGDSETGTQVETPDTAKEPPPGHRKFSCFAYASKIMRR